MQLASLKAFIHKYSVSVQLDHEFCRKNHFVQFTTKFLFFPSNNSLFQNIEELSALKERVSVLVIPILSTSKLIHFQRFFPAQFPPCLLYQLNKPKEIQAVKKGTKEYCNIINIYWITVFVVFVILYRLKNQFSIHSCHILIVNYWRKYYATRKEGECEGKLTCKLHCWCKEIRSHKCQCDC